MVAAASVGAALAGSGVTGASDDEAVLVQAAATTARAAIEMITERFIAWVPFIRRLWTVLVRARVRAPQII